MRRSLRHLAAVKPFRYLEAGSPTGLTGLYTHPAPQSTLIYLYTKTLSKLQELPESSLYRQSTEALTKHRMAIVSAVIPEGHKEWAEKSPKTIAEHSEAFNTPEGSVPHDAKRMAREAFLGSEFVTDLSQEERDELMAEWDREFDQGPQLEGTKTAKETKKTKSRGLWGLGKPGSDLKTEELDPEPMLTADQISEIENKIGAGLIEEVIQVAEGELKLVDVLAKAKVWEGLEEKPVEGQWEYFKRSGVLQNP